MNRYCVTKPTYVVQADAAERAAVDLTGFEGTATEGAGGAEDAAETRPGGDEEKDTALKSRKPASRVWQFFSPRYHSSKDQRVCIKCKLCDLELTYSNTTNMHNHLVRKHSSDYLQDLASGKKVTRVNLCLPYMIIIH